MKIALITGATSGIGYEISERLLKMNYIVYGIGRNFIKNREEIYNKILNDVKKEYPDYTINIKVDIDI